LFNYLRSHDREEDEADRAFEEKAGHFMNQAMPYMQKMEEKARKEVRKIGKKA